MKFWKINEKALRCVLKLEELKEQDIRLDEDTGCVMIFPNKEPQLQPKDEID